MSTVYCAHTSALPQVELPARPEAIAFPPTQSALIVVDMQNAYATPGGYLDLAGFDVSATTPVIEKIAQAVAAARAAGGFAAEPGDARTLRFPDRSFDAVLLLGPLYHLRDRADRLAALGEARRVLRPGGVLLAGAISRVVAATDLVTGAGFADLPGPGLLRLLETGESPLDPADGFPAGHFHTAAELAGEVEDAGLRDVTVAGVEGPGSFALELVPPDDQVVAAAVVLAERAQGHPASPDLSGHLLAVARR